MSGLLFVQTSTIIAYKTKQIISIKIILRIGIILTSSFIPPSLADRATKYTREQHKIELNEASNERALMTAGSFLHNGGRGRAMSNETYTEPT